MNTSLFGTGWGAGTWGRNTWGSAASLTLTDVLRIWGHDNFGEDLVLNVQDEGVFYWDASAVSALDTRAVKLSTLAGAKSCPTKATKVIVSDRDRHVIAFGADGLGGANDAEGNGVQDPLLIRFSDQENAADWFPTPENTAGDLTIGSGSQIVTAVETRQQVIVFTDISLYSMQFIGPRLPLEST